MNNAVLMINRTLYIFMSRDTRATVLRINKYFEHTARFRWFF